MISSTILGLLERGQQLQGKPWNSGLSWDNVNGTVQVKRTINDTAASDLCMDLAHGKAIDDNPVLLWDCDSTNPNQQWWFIVTKPLPGVI